MIPQELINLLSLISANTREIAIQLKRIADQEEKGKGADPFKPRVRS